MGTKNKPGTYDCYANAHPDEPMFILLGRDPFAAMLVEKWAELRELARGPSAKVDEARACAKAMREWVPRYYEAVGPTADTPETQHIESIVNAAVHGVLVDEEQRKAASLLPSTPEDPT